MVGFGQVVVIAIIFFFLFGANKMTSFMSDLARGLKSFQKIMKEDDSSVGQGKKPDEADKDNIMNINSSDSSHKKY